MKVVCSMVVFGIILMIWVLIGFIGGLNANTNKTNWFMIGFIAFSLFIPVIAKVCGMC